MSNDSKQYSVIYRVHALKRMFERDISEIEVSDILKHGDVISEYPDDYPYPSKLLKRLLAGEGTFHVLSAENTWMIIVITVYEPDPNLWDSEFRRKIK